MQNKDYLVALVHTPALKPKTLLTLLDKYKLQPQEVWQAPATDLAKWKVPQEQLEAFLKQRSQIDVGYLSQTYAKRKIHIITFFEHDYPQSLKHIDSPPLALFIQGELEPLHIASIAIVGTRKTSSYGKLVCQQFTEDFVNVGLTIVSGLAYGIDAVAHQTALDSNGQTIAIIASGLDNITPQAHESLAMQIVKNHQGCILSEEPFGTTLQKFSFPKRNRLISALSLATVVIEAGEKSGALITAHFAAEQGKEVFAIPGSIFSPVSLGTAKLIQEGAHCVTNPQQVIEALDIKTKKQAQEITALLNNHHDPTPFSAAEEYILTKLQQGEKHIDELVRESTKPAKDILAALTLCEVTGKVKNLGGGWYVKI